MALITRHTEETFLHFHKQFSNLKCVFTVRNKADFFTHKSRHLFKHSEDRHGRTGINVFIDRLSVVQRQQEATRGDGETNTSCSLRRQSG